MSLFGLTPLVSNTVGTFWLNGAGVKAWGGVAVGVKLGVSRRTSWSLVSVWSCVCGQRGAQGWVGQFALPCPSKKAAGGVSCSIMALYMMFVVLIYAGKVSRRGFMLHLVKDAWIIMAMGFFLECGF